MMENEMRKMQLNRIVDESPQLNDAEVRKALSRQMDGNPTREALSKQLNGSAAREAGLRS
jgi:hypothetical protein